MPLTRFSVSLDAELLRQFDVKNKADRCPNRSKAVGDLIRAGLVQRSGNRAKRWRAPSSWSMIITSATW